MFDIYYNLLRNKMNFIKFSSLDENELLVEMIPVSGSGNLILQTEKESPQCFFLHCIIDFFFFSEITPGGAGGSKTIFHKAQSIYTGLMFRY